MKNLSKREQSKLVCCAECENFSLKGKKIEIKNEKEVLADMLNGIKVAGRMWLEKTTEGNVVPVFQRYNRKKRRKEKVIIQLEHGWLKESPNLIKFYNAVNKNLDLATIDHVMKRELKTAMRALLGDKLVELLKDDDDEEIKTTGKLFLEGEGIE